MGKQAFIQSANPFETTEEEATQRLGTSVSADGPIVNSPDLIDHNKVIGPTGRSSHKPPAYRCSNRSGFAGSGFRMRYSRIVVAPF